MKIIFDGTILGSGVHKNSARSGIFFTAYELLSALSARDDVKVLIYANAEVLVDVYDFIRGRTELAAVELVKIRHNRFLCKAFGWLMAHAVPREWRGSVFRMIPLLPYMVARKIALKALGFYFRLVRRSMFQKVMASAGDECCFLSPVFYPGEEVVKSGLKRFFVLYDVIPQLFPQFYVDVKGVAWTQALCESLTEEDYGFAISEATRRDFQKFAPRLDDAKVSIIPLAASERFCECEDGSRRLAVRRKYGITPEHRYFLSLCTIEPRKNLKLALTAFARVAEKYPDVDFVLAGSKWTVYSDQWKQIISGLGKYRDRVVLPGYVDDEDQAALYSDASAFIYISLYEGFGLPPLEAMQCGCPVLTSNTSSLPEVVGDAGLMVDPNDLDAVVAAMTRLVNDGELRNRLRAKGFERARMFRWGRAAEIMVDKMKEALGCSTSKEGLSR